MTATLVACFEPGPLRPVSEAPKDGSAVYGYYPDAVCFRRIKWLKDRPNFIDERLGKFGAGWWDVETMGPVDGPEGWKE